MSFDEANLNQNVFDTSLGWGRWHEATDRMLFSITIEIMIDSIIV